MKFGSLLQINMWGNIGMVLGVLSVVFFCQFTKTSLGLPQTFGLVFL
jgi:hypothetical protein